MFNQAEKKFILQLAHQSIEHYFNSREILSIQPTQLPSQQLKERRACFVTLELNGNLRGCVGHLESVQPLYLDIIDNAVFAAFQDTRFYPLTEVEFKNIDIEVSVLTVPEPLEFIDWQELAKKLRPNLDGVIIQRGIHGATYLPQVWENLPAKDEFLSSLCLKAGLAADDWQKSGMKVWTYQVEIIKN